MFRRRFARRIVTLPPPKRRPVLTNVPPSPAVFAARQQFLRACSDGDVATVKEMLANQSCNPDDELPLPQQNTQHKQTTTSQDAGEEGKIDKKEKIIRSPVGVRSSSGLGGSGNRNESPAFTTGLHAAAVGGFCEVVEALLSDPRVFPDQRDSAGMTALHKAAEFGQVDVLNLLLDDPRVDPSAQGNGTTPLHLACREGRAKIVQILLEDCEVDPNAGLPNGMSPLLIAATRGHPFVLHVLLQDARIDPQYAMGFGGTTALLAAIRGGHDCVIAEMIKNAKVRPNFSTSWDKNPLLVAAQRGQGCVVKMLLSALNAENAESEDVVRALRVGCAKDYPAVVRVLIGGGVRGIEKGGCPAASTCKGCGRRKPLWVQRCSRCVRISGKGRPLKYAMRHRRAELRES